MNIEIVNKRKTVPFLEIPLGGLFAVDKTIFFKWGMSNAMELGDNESILFQSNFHVHAVISIQVEI